MAAALGVLRTLSAKSSLPLATERKYYTESTYYKRFHENDNSLQASKDLIFTSFSDQFHYVVVKKVSLINNILCTTAAIT